MVKQFLVCKIADLITEIPKAGGLAPRCQEYLYDGNELVDIRICADDYRYSRFSDDIPYDAVSYMESAYQFCYQLLDFDGLYLHASAIEWEGKAYLFSGPSGIGKSTHTRLWQSVYPDAQIFNDDKPALRFLDGQWFAYGTPWCGKDGININMKAPLGGICFLRRGETNAIHRLPPPEAVTRIISQTTHRFQSVDRLDMLLQHVEKLVSMITVYELYCLPDADAVRLSSETMRRGAEEIEL